MSIDKSIAFAAPYKSSTFNTAQQRMMGRNGVLRGGLVTTSGGIVTIQPLDFIQEGCIRHVTNSLSAPVPAYLSAPYYVVVSNSTTIQNPSEIITPTFVKRPEDITPNMVLVASWDGSEWHSEPYVGGAEIVAQEASYRVLSQQTGILDGLLATKDASNLYISPGSAAASDGTFFETFKQKSFALFGADSLVSGGYLGDVDRIDECILRKPSDSLYRPAQLQYLIGALGGPDVSGITPLSYSLSSSSPGTAIVKTVNKPSDNSNVSIASDGSGALTLYVQNPDLSSPTAASIATGIGDFDFAINPDDSIDIVYTKGLSVYYKRVDYSGADIYAEAQIYLSTVATNRPKMAIISESGTYHLHIVFEKETSGSQTDLYYVRISPDGSIATDAQIFISLSAILKNASLSIDEDDSLLFVAFENNTTGRIYLRSYDIGTATSTEPPAMYDNPLELQDDTYDIDTSTLLATTGALEPIVIRSSTKQTYVFWRHLFSSGNYVLSIYNENYFSKYGHKAIAVSISETSGNEFIKSFAACVDNMDTAHILANDSSSNVQFLSLFLEQPSDSDKFNGIHIYSGDSSSLSTCFTKTGSFAVSYCDLSTGAIEITKQAAQMSITKRKKRIPSCDISIARYSNETGKISSSGTFIEENISVRRLYDFFNMFAATGSVTWDAGTATLTINTDITVEIFGKDAVYTIQAQTFSLTDGQVCYFNLPDDDLNTQVLALTVQNIFDGILDRTNRTMVPVFWNYSNVLYTKFAPFRIGDSETIIIGEALTQQMKQWLGAASAAPDPTNHGYSSTNFITQSTSINDAIGLLDAAIQNVPGGAIPIRFADGINTTLPTGAVTIDGLSISAGDMGLFTNLNTDNNLVYTAEGTGTSITGWTASEIFKGSSSPYAGVEIYITEGDMYTSNYFFYDGTSWRNRTNDKRVNTLLEGQTNKNLFIFDKTYITNVHIAFSLDRGSAKRTGLFVATTDGTSVGYDSFETGFGDIGVSLTAVIMGTYFIVQYTSTTTGTAPVMERTISAW